MVEFDEQPRPRRNTLPSVTIRPSIASTIYLYTFSALWIGFLGTVAVRGFIERRILGSLLLTVVFIAPVAATTVRAHRLGVRTHGRRLIIGRFLRSIELDADEISDFTFVQSQGRPPVMCVVPKVGPGIELPGAGQPFWGIGRRRAEARCLQLHEWLRAARGGEAPTNL